MKIISLIYSSTWNIVWLGNDAEQTRLELPKKKHNKSSLEKKNIIFKTEN